MAFVMAGVASASVLFDGSFHLTDTWTGYGKPFGAWSFTTLPSKDTLIVSKSDRDANGVIGKLTHYTVSTPGESSVDRGLLGSNTVHNLPNGYVVWSGFSIKLAPSWTFPYVVDNSGTRGWELFWEVQQMFTLSDGKDHAYSPSMQIGFTNGDNPLKFNYLPVLGKPITQYPLLSLTPGVWYDIMVNSKLTTNNDGYFYVYMREQGESDYSLILSKTGIPTLLQQNTSLYGPIRAYSSAGYYRTHSTLVKSIYFESIKYGTTRADVEYGGSSTPNPTPTPTCSDNIQNGDETGKDCGGPCPACSTSPTPLTLKPGWNQISSPLAAGISLATIESSCTILQYKNQKLWAWNSTAQVWTNPAKVEPLKGYWIYAAYQCNVPLSGTTAAFSSLQLYNGWNKISASGTFSAIQGTCAGHITGNWIWNWDKTTEKWIHPVTMQLYKGYWIKVDQNCVLGV